MVRRWFVLAVALFMSEQVPANSSLAQVLPTVTLKTQLDQSTVHVGDTLTATVSAMVTNGGAADGIVAYDLDIFPLDKSGISFVGSVVQPPLNAVSAGTPDVGTGGRLGVTGLYDSPGAGIGFFVNLFTFQIHADAPGANSVSAGLSVFPAGTGIPFLLDVSGAYADPSGPGPVRFLVDSSGAVAPLTVLPVPEPATALLLGGTLLALGRRPQRRSQ